MGVSVKFPDNDAEEKKKMNKMNTLDQLTGSLYTRISLPPPVD